MAETSIPTMLSPESTQVLNKIFQASQELPPNSDPTDLAITIEGFISGLSNTPDDISHVISYVLKLNAQVGQPFMDDNPLLRYGTLMKVTLLRHMNLLDAMAPSERDASILEIASTLVEDDGMYNFAANTALSKPTLSKHIDEQEAVIEFEKQLVSNLNLAAAVRLAVKMRILTGDSVLI